jgi:hypothetical protein
MKNARSMRASWVTVSLELCYYSSNVRWEPEERVAMKTRADVASASILAWNVAML